MSQIKFCLKCGKPLNPDEKFCGGCGASVEHMQAKAASVQSEGNQETVISESQTENTANNFAANGAQTQPVNEGVAFGESNMFGQEQNMQNGMPPYSGNYIPNSGMPEQNGTSFGTQQGTVQGMPNQNFGGAPYQQNQGQFNQNQAGMGFATAAQTAQSNPFESLIGTIKKNPKIAIIIAGGVIVFIVLLIIVINALMYTRIDAKDIVKVKYEGIDGCGTASADFDYQLADAQEFSGNSTKDSAIKLALYASDVKAVVDNAENLKNGDTVKVTVTYNEHYLKKSHIKLKNTEFEAEVTGLSKGEKIDLFKGLKVEFSGNDGYGQADVDTSGAYPFIYYDYDYVSNLSNGDKYSVTAKCSVTMKKSGNLYWFKYDGKYYVCSKKTDKKEYSVKGLNPLNELDAFANVTLETKGASPYLVVSGVNTEKCTDTVKDYVRFDIEDEKILKTGDKVTVTATASSSLASYGYKLKETTKEFEINANYPVYITKDTADRAISALSDKIKTSVNKFKTDNNKAYYINNVDLEDGLKKINSVNLVDTYVSFTTDTTPSFNKYSGVNIDTVNKITQIYEVKAVDKKSRTVTFYLTVTLKNVISNQSNFTFNGKSSYDADPYLQTFASKSDAEDEIKSDYTMKHEKLSDSGSSAASTTTSAATTTTTTAKTTTQTTTTQAAKTTTKKAA